MIYEGKFCHAGISCIYWWIGDDDDDDLDGTLDNDLCTSCEVRYCSFCVLLFY